MTTIKEALENPRDKRKAKIIQVVEPIKVEETPKKVVKKKSVKKTKKSD